MKIVLHCEDCLEGIFSGVYEGWAGRYGHECIELKLGDVYNIELFAQYIEVPTDRGRAAKVENTIRKRMGEEVFDTVARAALSCEADKGTVIYRLIVKALSMERPGMVLEAYTEDCVARVRKLSLNVWNEAHHLLGFIRFEELKSGGLLSVIGAKNQVLPIVAPHFSDRLPTENWIIYDRNREQFAVHIKERDWVLVRGERLEADIRKHLSSDEKEFQRLWRGFCSSTMVQGRENPELQNQLLPKRFQKFMTEFQEHLL